MGWAIHFPKGPHEKPGPFWGAEGSGPRRNANRQIGKKKLRDSFKMKAAPTGRIGTAKGPDVAQGCVGGGAKGQGKPQGHHPTLCLCSLGFKALHQGQSNQRSTVVICPARVREGPTLRALPGNYWNGDYWGAGASERENTGWEGHEEHLVQPSGGSRVCVGGCSNGERGRIRIAEHPLEVHFLLAVRAGLFLPHNAPAPDAELVKAGRAEGQGTNGRWTESRS